MPPKRKRSLAPKDLKPGLRFRYGGVAIEILREGEHEQDRFGQTLHRWWSRDLDTGKEGYISLGPTGKLYNVDVLDHATKKKSPAQLQREIDETLAQAPKKVAGFARPATRQPGYQIVSVPILKGPHGIGPSGLDSPREHNESVVFSTRAEAEAYLPAVKRFAADFGREAVIKEVW